MFTIITGYIHPFTVLIVNDYMHIVILWKNAYYRIRVEECNS